LSDKCFVSKALLVKFPVVILLYNIFTVTNLTDEQLVEMAVTDNPEAFSVIVNRWERKIFALCYGMLSREDEAKDAAQETFIAAFRNLKNFRGDAKVSSWLHRIAVNQCLTTKRRTKTRSESFLGDEENEGEKIFIAPLKLQPSKTAEQSERLQIVRQAVYSLPLDLRQIIVLKEFEDMTFQQISETLDMPLSTVKSRLYTALKQLRMKLERMPMEIV
jgi:RNA polymerase sigma-70 factor (ECF subfamily)